jgi:site-specific DNA-cytosine methylase
VIIELFAGLISLSLAFAPLNISVIACFFSETCPDAVSCIRHHFPNAGDLGDICKISRRRISELVQKYPDAKFCLGGGPPCQDVSELNATAAGANGSRSVLREEYDRVYQYLKDSIEEQKAGSSEGRLLGILECTRMRPGDRPAYDKIFSTPPFELCDIPL